MIRAVRNLQLHIITGLLNRLLLFSTCALFGCTAFAQQPELSLQERENLISKIENLAERADQELDYSDLLDDLYYLLENPMPLNEAGFDELAQLFFLSDFQIHKLIEYRNMYGDFLSIYEMQVIEGFNRDVIMLIEPFVTLEAAPEKYRITPGSILKYGRHDLYLRYQRNLEQQAGFAEITDSVKTAEPNSYYLGGPDRLYLRYGFRYFDKFRLGLTADKDPGEEFFKGSQPNGFDFYSAFAWAEDLGFINKLVIGDYHAEFGQGLTLWTGLAFGKSPDAISLIRNRTGLRPNTSVNENLYLRGIASTLDIGNFEITGFYSAKKIDANIGEYDSLGQDILFITSLQQTGYHRTNAEMEDRHAIKETIFGAHAGFRKSRLKIGATAYRTLLNKPLQINGSLYQKFYFRGDENLNLGLDFNFLLGRFNFFGELSAGENGGKAYLAGCQATLSPLVRFAVLYRNYGLKYQNLYSMAFGEGSRNQGEKGLYTGISLNLHEHWSLNGYADFFKFPWIRYRVDSPSDGEEYMLQLNYTPSRDMELYFRIKTESKYLNKTSETVMPEIEALNRDYYRINLAYNVLPQLILKNRIEISKYKHGSDPTRYGFLIYQDVLFRPEEKPYDFSLRYAIFDTDTFDSRIYAYENDVLYAFSIPAYYYTGSRFYALLKYELSGYLDLWLRFARTFYSNRDSIGNGLSEIDGNTRTEVKIQLRLKL